MLSGRYVFSQIMSYLPLSIFRQCVSRYNGEYKVRKFRCFHQYLCMAFAQLTERESLRGIEICLRSHKNKLYHIGISSQVSRSTLAEANENRDWRIYRDFAYELIAIARDLYADDDFGLELENTVYAMDSSTIDLCLSVFPWAKFRKKKGAVKLHTLLDLRGSIPAFIHISDGKLSDVIALDFIDIEAGAFYIIDRGYTDFERLYKIHQSLAFFVIRAKKNLQFKRVYSKKVDRSTGLVCDQTIVLTNPQVFKKYPEKLRRIKYYDKEIKKTFVFLTNNNALPAMTIAKLYKCRWQVELFFKWIKQHLRIKKFWLFLKTSG